MAASDLIDQQVYLPAEGGAFSMAEYALDYLNMPEGSRTMANFYRNRAYPGAPPSIPHPLISETGIGGTNCLQCHQKGGFTPQFNAYAPVTPHPEWHNCLQCHVQVNTATLFKESNWEKPPPPRLGIQALATSPIVMPHGLQGRENCLSCHAGPAVPKELRVTHPERINCRQCHVPPVTEELFYKPEPLPAPTEFDREAIGARTRPLPADNIALVQAWIQKQ